MRGYRLTIESTGSTKARAVRGALTICGMICTDAKAPGWSCGGTDGNTTGRMEEVPDGMSISSPTSEAAKMDTPNADALREENQKLRELIREVMNQHEDIYEPVGCSCDWCQRAAQALVEGKG